MSSMFKILYCTGSLASKGGVERVLSTKSTLFAEKYNIEVHICTLDGKSPAFDFSKKIKFHTIQFNRPKTCIPIVTNIRINKLRYEAYEKLIRKISPNIVIVLERGSDDFYLPNICHKLNIPIAREFHFARQAVYEYAKLMPLSKRCNYLLKYKRIFRAFNNYDWLILLTKRDQEEGHYKCKTIVIPNIIPLSNDIPQSNYSNKIAITVGSMHDHRKGFLSLIRIWEKVKDKHPDWQLHIFGGGAVEQEIKQYVIDQNLTDYVKVCGVSHQIENEYAKSSFFLAASVAEGLPMVLIEAMGCGLPCISYDTPTGPSDIITDGIDGKIIPFKDDNHFLAEILHIIENPQTLSQMGHAALEKSQNFDEEHIIPLWLNFFSKFGY